ncbi:uncharacterized protein A1O9_12189 [Exophiala aquamarina CBS 119918]|uniref:Uncharacterized protein n=1 Tax=Exophiala aquamarina CBS 119918 TaxID=1182545 RepID=A0A072NW83_9EURO|nr:uncharacterized protein A1O9_12189 [Exophiala aquamarina CBS 119918]KEF51851.1 hypothetical protein A1O9_12189 [Exophiala aquamarina CBS 119918]
MLQSIANRPPLYSALLIHVYQYFGEFYGCSEQGSAEFPKYKGVASMYEVHKFMKSDPWESGYFNEQIVLAAKSLGFEEADCDFTSKALAATFGRRCSPAAPVIPASAGPQLQAICVSESCPLDLNATCSAYPDDGFVPFPEIANATLAGAVVKENDREAPSNASASASSFASGASTGSAASGSLTGGASTLDLNGALKVIGTLATIVGAGLFVVPV